MPARPSLFARSLQIAKLAAILLIIISAVLFPFIPKKSFTLYPGEYVWWGAYSDVYQGGNTQFKELNADKSEVTCTMGDNGTFTMCGNNIVFGDYSDVTQERLMEDVNFAILAKPKITKDLSMYDGLWLDIDYKGAAEHITVTLQNHEPAPNQKKPSRQFRHQSVSIDTAELGAPVYVRMKDFKVADWWIYEFNLHRTEIGSRFDSIRAVAVEIKNEPAGTEHYLHIKNITFTGEWISREQFYFVIIVVLMALLIIEAAVRFFTLRQNHHRTQRSLELMKAHNHQLHSAAYKDALTQLLNRRAVYEIILKDRALSTYQSYAVLVIDIDHFKDFNDNYGHAVGDHVLIQVAKLLTQNSRSYDHIVRWGGEEFVIITTANSADHLSAFAEKLQIAVCSSPLCVDDCNEVLNITISIGATCIESYEDFDSAFKRADHALYAAKNGGRNRSVYQSA